MKFHLLLLIVSLGLAAAEDMSIESFEEKFGQMTNDKEIEAEEAEALEENEKVIDEINEEYKEGKATFYESLNPLSDVPDNDWNDPNEFKGAFLPDGKVRGLGAFLPPESERVTDPESEAYFRRFRLNRGSAPASYDAVALGLVTPVKDQQQCGSCAAFASIATIETCIKDLGGKEVDLSEQHLVNCGYNKDSMNGCDGAQPHAYNEFVSKNSGLVPHETTVPYINDRTSCASNPAYNPGVQVIGEYHTYDMDEETMKGIVADRGSVLAAIYASDKALQNYAGGVFSGCTSKEINHAVTVVGYGEENGDKYWKVKNSWGKMWGEDGYIKILRGVNECGIGKLLSAPNCQGSNGATSAPVTTPAPSPKATCDISPLYGPGISYSTITITTTINNVEYIAKLSCVNSLCTPKDPVAYPNACQYICGKADNCNFGAGRSALVNNTEIVKH